MAANFKGEMILEEVIPPVLSMNMWYSSPDFLVIHISDVYSAEIFVDIR